METKSPASDLSKSPPRLCARYLSHVAPSQSIRSLFANIPGHIVLRSSRYAESDSRLFMGNGKKREVSDLKPSRAKKFKASVQSKGISNKDPFLGQRSMNDFFKRPLANEAKKYSPEPRDSDYECQDVVAQEEVEADTANSIPPDARFVKNNLSASEQWTSIFTKKGPPLCETHGLPCIELVTKKAGPNLGRKFWICSKPVGPGYDNGKSMFEVS